MSWKYEYLVEQLHRTAYKKHEAFIIGNLFNDPELQNLKPITQYYARRTDFGYALLDLYYPQLNIAIEIDEPHHEKNKKNDEKRQCSVVENIACEFYRISISNGNILQQVADLKLKLIAEKTKRENAGILEQWNPPNILNIDELKNMHQKTLFIKIRGEIPPNELLARQTGYWRFAKNKLEKIDFIVIVHNGLITRIFNNIKWHKCQEQPNKWGFTATENDEHELVGTIVKEWKTQQTITYSTDMY